MSNRAINCSNGNYIDRAESGLKSQYRWDIEKVYFPPRIGTRKGTVWPNKRRKGFVRCDFVGRNLRNVVFMWTFRVGRFIVKET